ncbi:hypothetical protein [Nocardia sp. NPDC046763]|uniref:hypothetical protein n=1 Tax=Nocardia sp. NPDC046763 TaxID=3155256 RepID=UPI0033F97E31
MSDHRTPGKRGRLPALAAADRFPLKYLHEYTRPGQPLPTPQYPVDVSQGITDWGMLGNGPDPACSSHPNGVGDCTFAGRQHYRMAKAARGQESESWESSNDLVAEYLTYDHGVDKGANIAHLLLTWYRAGKILAFAPVDHTDPAAVDAAMAAFTGTYCGVSLTDDADQLFSRQRPWTVANGEQPDPSEGHCILKVAADGNGTDTWVTWGAQQQSTTAWTAVCLDEAWVVITQEDTNTHLIDIAALRADINALNGTGG